MVLDCVVCKAPVSAGEARYSNTWERSRRRYPCCSEACAQAFDADLHWLPAVEPEPADQGEQRRLLAVARQRLMDGDNPSVITRELLLAGVAALALRKVLGLAHADANSSREDARRQTVWGVLTGLFTGNVRVAVNADPRRPDAMELALDDLETWRQHWVAKTGP